MWCNPSCVVGLDKLQFNKPIKKVIYRLSSTKQITREKMASISASTPTLLPKKPSTLHGLPTICQMGKVRCSTENGTKRESSPRLVMTGVSSLVATTTAAAMSSPIAMALVDERMSTEGTGLPFGLSNNLLGWILFGVFGLIWTFYFAYTGSLDEDDDSGLSL